MTPPTRRSPALLAAGLATIYVLWGTTYLGIRVGVESIPPFFLSGVRYTIAGLLLFAWVALRGALRDGWPTRRQWVAATITGTSMILVGNGVLTWAEVTVPSGLAAIMYATPLWLAILAWSILGERIRPVTAVGLVIGFVGLVFLLGPSRLTAGSVIPDIAVIVASLGWAVGAVLSKRLELPRNPFQVAGMQMFCGGVATFAVSLLSGDAARFHPAAVSARSELAFVYLLLVGAVLGFGVFAWLVRSAPLALVGTYGYVNPMVAVVLGAVLLGEAISLHELVGGVIVLAGVALIVSAQSTAAGAKPAAARADPGGAAVSPPEPADQQVTAGPARRR